MHRVFERGGFRRVARGAPVLALMLAACGTLPDAREFSPVSPDAALAARAALVAREDALIEEAAPVEWWRLFGDATLTALQDEAASANLDLQAAAARVEESRARLGLANAARRPQLFADGGYARSALSEHSPLAALGAPTDA
ncbi:MAG: hypothetical protein LBD68_02155, partial [Zoogloeaceae bacterium]|nr:hypothetical protein [Zoogloeaceae bacterium]